MKILFFMMLLALALDSKAGSFTPPVLLPWMDKLWGVIDPPVDLLPEEQQVCAQRILDSLNRRFDANLSETDLAPVYVPGWEKPEMGFVHGGGFNIRISASELKGGPFRRIRTGRFNGKHGLLKNGLVPSLHVPKKINGARVFYSWVSGQTEQVDFVAHIDSAYAYLPLGLLSHLFRDVLGSGSRNPCPD